MRTGWINDHLERTAHKARLYTWGWGAGILGATVANAAPLLFVSPDQRIDWYTGTATTIVGVVPLLIAPLEVIDDARQLSGLRRQWDPVSDPCPLLLDAETRLARDAQNQIDGQRWWLHAGNVLLNGGVGLFLGLGFRHWKAGAFNAIGGSLIGEAIIFTQPTSSIADMKTYRAGQL